MDRARLMGFPSKFLRSSCFRDLFCVSSAEEEGVLYVLCLEAIQWAVLIDDLSSPAVVFVALGIT